MAADTDRVVAELDVYSCRTLLAEQTQIALFQYPLRPPWRPYEMPETSKIKVKPNARRIEMTVPLDKGENYNEDVEDAKKLEGLTLRSRPTDLTTSYALGQVRDGKVYLMPIDEAAQLRPQMSHMDQPVAKDTAPELEAPAAPELVALQVTVQRRETERQIQNKLNSHAYISKLEADEDWVDVDLGGIHVAESFWEQMEQAPHADLDMSLSRKAYLTALMPGPGADDDQVPTSPKRPTSPKSPGSLKVSAQEKGLPNGTKAKAGSSKALPSKPDAQQPSVIVHLSAQEKAALQSELVSMFRHSAVSTLPQIRRWLLDAAKKKPELDGIASCADLELKSAVTQLEIVHDAAPAFVHIPNDNVSLARFRKEVLALLASRSSVKKAEIMDSVRKAGIDMSEGQCMRAIKEICKSQGTSWHLKL